MADVILVTTSPCTVAQRFPSLAFIVSKRPHNEPCLRFERTVQWSGATQSVYAVG